MNDFQNQINRFYQIVKDHSLVRIRIKRCIKNRKSVVIIVG